MAPSPRLALLLCALLALTTAGALAVACAHLNSPDSGAVPEVLPQPVALLDGVVLPTVEATIVNERPPIAVMIDNLPGGARPQVGLDRADLVYELLVEGGITRFMAVYLRQEAEWLEPVRSVRTPAVVLARELGAVLVHVGAAHEAGEADAARWIAEWEVRTLDGDVDEAPFHRDGERAAPHNMVTSTTALRARVAEHGWTAAPAPASWLYQDEHGEDGHPTGAARQIDYNFALTVRPHPAFAAAWSYDDETNSYLRSMAGAPHVDGHSGERLRVKNVILQVLRAVVVSREGHVVYDQLGEGQAWVFRDGQVIEAVWSKRSTEDRSRFWDQSGEEIRLNRGATWVALLPAGSPMRWE